MQTGRTSRWLRVRAFLPWLVLIVAGLGPSAASAQNRLVPTFFRPIHERTGNSAIVLMGRDTIPAIHDLIQDQLVPLDSLDEIGIFRRFPQGDSCVGAGVWQNEPLSITVWGDNEQTNTIDGMRAGDSLYVRVWHRSLDSLRVDVRVTYSADPPATVASPIYVPNGIYLVTDVPRPNDPGGGSGGGGGGSGGGDGGGSGGEDGGGDGGGSGGDDGGSDGPVPIFFTPEHETTGNLATVIVPVDANPQFADGTPLDSLDEIGVFQRLGDGTYRCVGAGVWQRENLAVTVWGDDNITAAIVEGMQPNDSLYYRVWDRSANVEYDSVGVAYRGTVPFWNTTGRYAPNDLYVLDRLVAYIGTGGGDDGGGDDAREPEHFAPEHEDTGTSATVLIPVQASPQYGSIDGSPGTPLDLYDEIGIFQALDDGTFRCVGAGVWLQSLLSITIWGDDVTTSVVMEGLLTGDSLYYRVWDRSADVEYDSVAVSYRSTSPDPALPAPTSTSGRFEPGARYMLGSLVAYVSSGGKGGGSGGEGGQPTDGSEAREAFQTRHRYEIHFYPNPGRSGEIRMAVQIPEANLSNYVRLKIYNTLGQEVASMIDGVVPEVLIHDEPLPFALPPGVYLYVFEAGPFVRQVGKFVVVR